MQAGLAEVFTAITTPHDRAHSSKTTRTTKIRVPASMKSFATLVESGQRRLKTSSRSVPVSGVFFDDRFFLSDSLIRCAPKREGVVECSGAGLDDATAFAGVHQAMSHIDRLNRHGARRESEQDAVHADAMNMTALYIGNPDYGSDSGPQLALSSNDEVTNYARGTRSVLVIPVCASQYPNCVNRFNRGRIRDNHDGDVVEYLQRVMSEGYTFFEENSFSSLQLTASLAIATCVVNSAYRSGPSPSRSRLHTHSHRAGVLSLSGPTGMIRTLSM